MVCSLDVSHNEASPFDYCIKQFIMEQVALLTSKPAKE